jgi:predicted permease
MAVFWLVFLKTISLLLSVVIGFLSGKYSNVQRDSIASLLFYFIAPIVCFSIPASTNLTLASLSISITAFIISSLLSLFSYKVFSRYWQDYNLNIIALSAGTANGGYFMLPIATSLFDDYTLSLYMMVTIGVNIYESSIGFYICARSFANTRDSLIQVLKLPTLISFFLGCIVSVSGFTLPDFIDDFLYDMKRTFSILGMMMIGLALSSLNKFEIDLKFTIANFIAKFIFYPLGIGVFVLLDHFIFNIYNRDYYNALFLFSTAPLATNLIVIANLQNFYPGKIAATVFLSLMFAVLYVPTILAIFFQDLLY